MINLFEHFDKAAHTLYHALKLAGHHNKTIVLEDDGFLPEQILTPYRYFSQYQVQDDHKPLYFNQIQVPRYWEIIGNNTEATVNDMGKVRAYIRYDRNSKPRIVSHVEWLDDAGRLQYVDHYTQHGVRFAQTVYDLTGNKIFRKYLDQQGHEVIYENFIAQSIIVNWQGRSHHFNHKVAFIHFFLREAGIDMNQFVINSLGLPFSVLYRLNEPGHDLLFWQENSGGHVPGNMSLMLQGEHTRDYHVIVPDQREYDILSQQLDIHAQQRLLPSGYLYDYARTNQYTANVLTMTNSDQIHHLADIVQACPKATFHIGAVTEMSDVLMAMDQYPNVRLYPAIERYTVDKLYHKCDIYLDINEGGEIINAAQRAFNHDMLILGYRDNAHNISVTASENLFDKENRAAHLIEALKDIQRKKRYFKVRLNYQKSHAHEITDKAFNQVMTHVIRQ
ncbi:accessory Sec system glycosylation chaperone GtfB [Staphylococcus muscae]|uniref:UDP-N-acetylglucosamine--peptide N-acetylglucosaminyltransferase stabilizing protein GtfB n=1 Tax=Staphylococcus muscae TaxID=1294 RepID=A0A240BU70_9STAP|nr:accessory Sec system glycosylation chaperone GtfB [Staphylococcus muscae]AVQ34056.1 accessory Sec system glycosylation chaperone GtfB [Staphylococcus muscae]PNZ03211.1 accessory Sec system glycosylation chaperone GtfB [Staphylococcus muscae]GGA82095.1 glycosyltransferase stabilizing protein Gtf2 [Staphylococcus muscae]SNV98603.1 accessory Sec system glycosyltransferase GtfB [Staphylococcus muscae]